jgi:hypothetical protein
MAALRIAASESTPTWLCLELAERISRFLEGPIDPITERRDMSSLFSFSLCSHMCRQAAVRQIFSSCSVTDKQSCDDLAHFLGDGRDPLEAQDGREGKRTGYGRSMVTELRMDFADLDGHALPVAVIAAFDLARMLPALDTVHLRLRWSKFWRACGALQVERLPLSVSSLVATGIDWAWLSNCSRVAHCTSLKKMISR